MVAMDALSCILSHDDAKAGLPWAQLVDEAGGLDRLEQLQEHENKCVAVSHVEMREACTSSGDMSCMPAGEILSNLLRWR